MKLKIVYEYSENADFPFVASTTINGRSFYSVSSKGYNDAENHLLKRIRKYIEREEMPQPKEIEI